MAAAWASGGPFVEIHTFESNVLSELRHADAILNAIKQRNLLVWPEFVREYLACVTNTKRHEQEVTRCRNRLFRINRALPEAHMSTSDVERQETIDAMLLKLNNHILSEFTLARDDGDYKRILGSVISLSKQLKTFKDFGVMEGDVDLKNTKLYLESSMGRLLRCREIFEVMNQLFEIHPELAEFRHLGIMVQSDSELLDSTLQMGGDALTYAPVACVDADPVDVGDGAAGGDDTGVPIGVSSLPLAAAAAAGAGAGSGGGAPEAKL